MSTSLYRHFDKNGALLYVGISLSWPVRTKTHAQTSRWFDQVDKVEIERFPTREAALLAEREAIRAEKPKFNVVHNRAPRLVKNHRSKLDPPAGRGTLSDPILQMIKGPDAVVGPALVYRDDKISVLVAHGESGSRGELAELVLGDYLPELPEWTHACASVITLRKPNDLRISEAADIRREIIQKLSAHLRSVESFNTDLALAVAYASCFPSEKSRQILDEVAAEKRAA